MAESEELVTIMSSTYMRRNIVIPSLLKRNKDVSALDGMKPIEWSLALRREYHALGACFTPYRALSSLQI
jgi:hypothetical protein